MPPGIVRSVQHGFASANRSWPLIGFVLGFWLLIGLPALLAVLATGVPASLLAPQEGVVEAPAPVGPGPAPVPVEPAAPAPEQAPPPTASPPAGNPPDLFDQMASPEPPAVLAPVSSPPLEPDAAEYVITPELERIQAQRRQAQEAEEAWVTRNWPVALACAVVLAAAGLWLYGGQVGYLSALAASQPARLALVWRAGTQAFGGLLGAALLSLAAGLALLAGFVLVTWSLSLLAGRIPDLLLDALALLVLVSLGVGVIWLSVRLVFWWVAIAARRLGPLAALRASWRASRGHWWRLLGLGVVLTVLLGGAQWALALVGAVLGGLSGAAGLVVGALFGVAQAVLGVYLGVVFTAALLRYFADVTAASMGGA